MENSEGGNAVKLSSIEHIAVAIVLLGQICIAPWAIDLFPFSSFPMFSDSPKTLLEYQFFSPQGEILSPEQFGMVSSYVANPSPKLSRKLPYQSLEQMSLEDIFQAVRERRVKEQGVVIVNRRVLGALDEKTVGIVSEDSWRVFPY